MTRLEVWVEWVDQYCSPDGCETIELHAGMLIEILRRAQTQIESLEIALDQLEKEAQASEVGIK